MVSSETHPSLTYRAGDQPVPGYRLLRELGRGAMGVVWLAVTDNGFERALKVIDLQQSGGRKEFRGLRVVKNRKILHGNLLTLIDYWLKDARGGFVADSADSASMVESQMFDSSVSKPKQTAASTATDLGETSKEADQAQRLGGTLAPAFTRVEESAPPAAAAPSSKGNVNRPVQLIVAMELGHKTLADRLAEYEEQGQKGIPIEELLAYMEQSARGLDYLHRQEILHRDVKPPNIMLVGDVAKVCDYGLVTETDTDLRATSLAFSPYYASPEAVNRQPLSGRSDLYSLAVSYIELRSGKLPYSKDTGPAVYATKETGEYDLSMVRKKPVRAVLKKALSTRPSERYASCSLFVNALKEAERSRPFVKLAVKSLVGLLLLLVALAGAGFAHPTTREMILGYLKRGVPEQVVKEIGRHEEILKESTSIQAALEVQHRERIPIGELHRQISLFRGSDVARYKDEARLLQARVFVGQALTGLGSWDPVAQELAKLETSLDDAEQRLVRSYLVVVHAGRPGTPPSSLATPDKPVQQSLDEVSKGQSKLQAILSPHWEFPALQSAMERFRNPQRESLLAEAKNKRIAGDYDGADSLLTKLDAELEADADATAAIRSRAAVARIHVQAARLTSADAADSRAWTELAQKLHPLAAEAPSLEAAALGLLVEGYRDPNFPSLDDQNIAGWFSQLIAGTSGLTKWDPCHLSSQEEQRLVLLKGQIAKALGDAAQPIPPHWRQRLDDVWPGSEVIDRLVARVDTRAGDESNGGLEAAVADLIAVYKDRQSQISDAQHKAAAEAVLKGSQSLLDAGNVDAATFLGRLAEFIDKAPSPVIWLEAALSRVVDGRLPADSVGTIRQQALDKVAGRLSAEERQRIEARIATLALNRFFVEQVPLSDDSIRREAREAIVALGEQIKDLPLPALLLTEIDLLEEKLDAQAAGARLDEIIRQLGSSTAVAGELEYARYLRICNNPARSATAYPDDFKVLLGWPEETIAGAAATWHTSRRTGVVRDLLVRLASGTLKVHDEDIDSFATPQQGDRDIQTIVLPYLDKAARLGEASLYAGAVSAIARARPAQDAAAPADWQGIGNVADAAASDAATLKQFAAENRGLLLEYVSALADSKLAAEKKVPLQAQSLRRFDKVLAGLFREDQPRQAGDRGLYLNVVQPALAAGAAQELAADDRVALGRLLGAQARLLERNADNLQFAPLFPPGEQDAEPSVLGLNAAHRAFEAARGQDPSNVTYAAGMGRTLLELPPSELDIDKTYEVISAILGEIPNADKHPSLLPLRAWAKEQVFSRETDTRKQPELIRDAIKVYEDLLANLTQTDPYDLKTWALVSASNAHVHAAFHTPISSGAEDKGEVQQWTKRWHLEKGERSALDAQADEGYRLRDWAFLSAGNAQEDLSFYLKRTHKYEDACNSFAMAASLAKVSRARAYAQFYLGRAQYRWADDKQSVFSSPAEKAAKLAEARASLESAVENWRDDANANVAETHYWLAIVRNSQLKQATEAAERIKAAKDAREHLHKAIEIAKRIGSDHRRLYLMDAAHVDLALAAAKDVADELGKAKLLDSAKTHAQTLLSESYADPERASAGYASLAIGVLGRASPSDAAALRQGVDFLREQSPRSDDWKAAYAQGLVQQALALGAGASHRQAVNDLLATAERTVSAIADGPLKRHTSARLQGAQGLILAPNLVRLQQPASRQDLARAKAHFAAAVEAILSNTDQHTQALLAELRKKSLTEILAFRESLTPLQRHLMEDALTKASSYLQQSILALEFSLTNQSVVLYDANVSSVPSAARPDAQAMRAALPLAIFVQGEATPDQTTQLIALQRILRGP